MTIPVEVEVEDNVKDVDIELMATDIAEESTLLKEYHYDFYDLEIDEIEG